MTGCKYVLVPVMVHMVSFILLAIPLFSQVEAPEENEEQLKGNHRITVALGHTHLAKGKDDDGDYVWLPVASWSFNYDFWITNRWAVGLQTDMVLEKFVVEDNDGEALERERPWSLVPVALFKPFQHFAFIAGAGIELEEDENFGLTRLGAEYSHALGKAWEAGIGVVWDGKWGHYNSWTVEFSFSKSFLKR